MRPDEPEILDYQARVDAFYPPDAVHGSVADQRRWYDALCRAFDAPRPGAVAAVDSVVTAPGRAIPIRSYRSAGRRAQATILWLHGGGFVVGSLDSHDAICAEICAATGAAVVAVDYRLAPEHPWPAAFDDCSAVLDSLAAAGRPVVLAGDSAGGTLAAGLALRARELRLAAVIGQALVYPGLGGDLDRGSAVEMARAPGLTTMDVRYYREITAAPWGDPHAYPLLAGTLDGLSPAFITVARFDPLRDDGRAYAGSLAAAGVDVVFREEPGMIHAWLRARHMSPGARRGFDALCAGLAQLAR